MTRNLVFDFGKVLVDYDFVDFFRRLIPDARRCMQLASIMTDDETLRRFDREEKPIEELVKDLISENPAFEDEIRLFAERYPEIITGEMPGMKELLVRLKGEGFSLYGLSNWCSKVYVTMGQYDIFQLMDGYVISSEEHLVKPEAGIYHRLYEKFGLKPEECIFADDKQENIEGARRTGMRGIVFENAAQYERELRRMLREETGCQG
ncbi:HAD family phosphatase [bacterium]|nr:HAD family phosphatase [bacterium]